MIVPSFNKARALAMARSCCADFTSNSCISVLILVFRNFLAKYNSSPVSTITSRKTQSVCSSPLILIYPRLISFESDRASGSTRQGWRKERCQPWMAVCATYLHGHSQNAAGTQGICPGMMIYCRCGLLAISCDQFR